MARFAGTLLVVLLVGGSARAQGNISIGLIQIHPSIALNRAWHSNIDLNSGRPGVANQTRSDNINTITPALALSLVKPHFNLSLDTGARVNRYQKATRNNGTDFFLNSTGVRGMYGQLGRRGLHLTASGAFGSSKDPYTQSTLEDQRYREGQAIERSFRDLGLELGFGLSQRYSILFSYNNNKLQYDDPIDFDLNQRQHVFGASLNLQMLPKTFARLGYTYSDRVFFDYNTVDPVDLVDVGEDARLHQLNVGLVWDQTDKLDGEVAVGYSWNQYQQGQDRSGNPQEDFSIWTLNADLQWQLRRRTLLQLNALVGQQEIVEAFFDSYDRQSVGIDIVQTLVHRMSFELGGGYEQNHYNPALGQVLKREYDIYTARVGAGYRLVNWVSVALEYSYQNKDVRGAAQYIDDQYTDHSVLFTITSTL